MQDAFSLVRSLVGSPRSPNLATKRFEDELTQMAAPDGLKEVPQYDVPVADACGNCPEVTADLTAGAHLWVVRTGDTVHAPEICDFGKSLSVGKVKHTNLTGGAPAYSGGELLWIGEREILINGCSGRYGPQTKIEMDTAALAFANAGYRVWSTGYDEGSGYCFKFGASLPKEVVPL